MKHRSVIAFVIVAAALFATPQLSHDLQNFRSTLGSRLRGELMRTFLSLPATEGAAAPVAPLPAEAQFASCTKGRPAARQRKNDAAPTGRAGVNASEQAGDRLAMITEPPPVSEPWSAALPGGSLVGAAELPRVSQDEVAMIIPPDSGVDPRGPARAAANVKAAQARRLAADVRVSYVAAGFDGKNVEWRETNEALRRLEASLPRSFELRLDRDGSKAKVLKVRRVAAPCGPCPAPRAPRPAGVEDAPLPVAVGALNAFVSE
jgi:hypothetical protein